MPSCSQPNVAEFGLLSTFFRISICSSNSLLLFSYFRMAVPPDWLFFTPRRLSSLSSSLAYLLNLGDTTFLHPQVSAPSRPTQRTTLNACHVVRPPPPQNQGPNNNNNNNNDNNQQGIPNNPDEPLPNMYAHEAPAERPVPSAPAAQPPAPPTTPPQPPQSRFELIKSFVIGFITSLIPGLNDPDVPGQPPVDMVA
jgi:hypothetical protein